jgi:hypothetical protein
MLPSVRAVTVAAAAASASVGPTAAVAAAAAIAATAAAIAAAATAAAIAAAAIAATAVTTTIAASAVTTTIAASASCSESIDESPVNARRITGSVRIDTRCIGVTTIPHACSHYDTQRTVSITTAAAVAATTSTAAAVAAAVAAAASATAAATAARLGGVASIALEAAGEVGVAAAWVGAHPVVTLVAATAAAPPAAEATTASTVATAPTAAPTEPTTHRRRARLTHRGHLHLYLAPADLVTCEPPPVVSQWRSSSPHLTPDPPRGATKNTIRVRTIEEVWR